MEKNSKSDEQKRFTKSLTISIVAHLSLLLIVFVLNLLFGLFQRPTEIAGARIVLVTDDFLGAISERALKEEKKEVESKTDLNSTQLASQKIEEPRIQENRPAERKAETRSNTTASPSSEASKAASETNAAAKPSSTDFASLFEQDSTPTQQTEYTQVQKPSQNTNKENTKQTSLEESLFSSEQLESLTSSSIESDNLYTSGGEASSSQRGSPDYSEVPLSLSDLHKTRTILKQSGFDLGGLDLGGRRSIDVLVEITVQANGFVTNAKVATTGNSEADRRIETTLTSKWLFSPVQGNVVQKYKVIIGIKLI